MSRVFRSTRRGGNRVVAQAKAGRILMDALLAVDRDTDIDPTEVVIRMIAKIHEEGALTAACPDRIKLPHFPDEQFVRVESQWCYVAHAHDGSGLLVLQLAEDGNPEGYPDPATMDAAVVDLDTRSFDTKEDADRFYGDCVRAGVFKYHVGP